MATMIRIIFSDTCLSVTSCLQIQTYIKSERDRDRETTRESVHTRKKNTTHIGSTLDTERERERKKERGEEESKQAY